MWMWIQIAHAGATCTAFSKLYLILFPWIIRASASQTSSTECLVQTHLALYLQFSSLMLPFFLQKAILSLRTSAYSWHRAPSMTWCFSSSGSSDSCTWIQFTSESCNLFWQHASQVSHTQDLYVWTSDEPFPRTWWQMRTVMEMHTNEHQYKQFYRA